MASGGPRVGEAMETEEESSKGGSAVARGGGGAVTLAVAAALAGVGALVWIGASKRPEGSERGARAADAAVEAGVADPVADPGLPGEALARLYCATCHLLPPPSAATKANWTFTLALMGHYLGVEDDAFRARFRAEDWAEMLDARRVPARPLIARSAFARLRAYYIESAPERFPPRAPSLRVDAPFMTAIEAAYRPEQGATTLVKIDARRRRVLVGDAAARLLVTVDARGRTVATSAALGSPVDLAFEGSDYLVTNIGILWTTNQRLGAVVRVPAAPSKAAPETIIRDLYRPAGGVLADLDGDGAGARVRLLHPDAADPGRGLQLRQRVSRGAGALPSQHRAGEFLRHRR